ncbi:MAG: glutathione S-transferase C-terminal domain-containing protein, partial [Sneathiella sp.]
CQRVRALAHVIAMDIHPVCNLNVVDYFLGELNDGPDRKAAWMQHFIAKGLSAFEAMLQDGESGEFCFGNLPGLADICLVPQLYNAERWQVDLSPYQLTTAIGDRCAGIDTLRKAYPDAVKMP